jgi:hypothetical protein
MRTSSGWSRGTGAFQASSSGGRVQPIETAIADAGMITA